jgi:hypothetical protein
MKKARGCAMKKWWFVLTLCALPLQAGAQTTDTGTPQPFRRWDADGGVALRVGEGADAVIPLGAWNAEFGRYWTPHIKTSIGIMTAGQKSYSGTQDAVSFHTTEATTGAAGYSAAVGYQFLENVFVHPFVEAGARFASSSATTTSAAIYPYRLLSIQNMPKQVHVRPVIGGGFKSYFDNGRAFMRSELLMSVDPHGPAHAILQIGAGIDF